MLPPLGPLLQAAQTHMADGLQHRHCKLVGGRLVLLDLLYAPQQQVKHGLHAVQNNTW